MTTPSLCVATPAYGAVVNTTYLRALMELADLCRTRGIAFESSTYDNCSMISHARNFMATQFLEGSDKSHLLFIDADMGFSANDVLSMLDHPEHEISAVICPKREINWRIIRDAVKQNPDIDPKILAALGGQFSDLFKLPAGVNSLTVGPRPIEVEAIGTGIMLIARPLLQRLVDVGEVAQYEGKGQADKVHEFFRAGLIDGLFTGEDIYFCNLARRHGATIYGFPGFAITHTGMYDFRGDLPGIVEYYNGPIQDQ